VVVAVVVATGDSDTGWCVKALARDDIKRRVSNCSDKSTTKGNVLLWALLTKTDRAQHAAVTFLEELATLLLAVRRSVGKFDIL
jgi:hypothetical protein